MPEEGLFFRSLFDDFSAGAMLSLGSFVFRLVSRVGL